MRMVISHYVGNDEFFDWMLITILFQNLCWDKAMKHVLRFANCPYFCFFKHINDEALNACVHALIVTIDELRVLYHKLLVRYYANFLLATFIWFFLSNTNPYSWKTFFFWNNRAKFTDAHEPIYYLSNKPNLDPKPIPILTLTLSTTLTKILSVSQKNIFGARLSSLRSREVWIVFGLLTEDL